MWEPRRLTTLRISKACCRNSCIFLYFASLIIRVGTFPAENLLQVPHVATENFVQCNLGARNVIDAMFVCQWLVLEHTIPHHSTVSGSY
jgi:hypothetical protein